MSYDDLQFQKRYVATVKGEDGSAIEIVGVVFDSLDDYIRFEDDWNRMEGFAFSPDQLEELGKSMQKIAKEIRRDEQKPN